MGAVYSGRFIAGIGIGQTVVVGPVYISEISPAPVRGLCTCVFTGAVYLGILLAYVANYAAEMNLNDTFNRWVCEYVVAGDLNLIFELRLGRPHLAASHVRWHYPHSHHVPDGIASTSD